MMRIKEGSCFSWSLILQHFTLAEYIQFSAFATDVINCLEKKLWDDKRLPWPTDAEITSIYSQTPGDCLLRRLVGKMHVLKSRITKMKEEEAMSRVAELPTEFAQDVVVVLFEQGWS
jgi:hypothetical protein